MNSGTNILEKSSESIPPEYQQTPVFEEELDEVEINKDKVEAATVANTSSSTAPLKKENSTAGNLNKNFGSNTSLFQRLRQVAAEKLLPPLPAEVSTRRQSDIPPTPIAKDTPHQSRDGLFNGNAAPGDVNSFVSVDVYNKCGDGTCCLNCPCCAGSNVKSPCSAAWWKDYIVGYKFVKPRNIVSSYFVSFYVIIVVRTIIMLYATSTLLAGISTEFEDGYWFAYFTHLSFLGLNMCYWFTVYYSFRHLLYPNRSLDRIPEVGEIITCILYTFAFTFHIIVPIIYWWLLGTDWVWAQNSPEGRWLNITQHGLDFLLILIEFFLNKIIYCWGHLLIMIIMMLGYIFWTWIFAAGYPDGGPHYDGFPYFFVNYHKSATGPWMVGITIIFIAVWSLSVFIHSLRAKVGKWLEKKRIQGRTVPEEIQMEEVVTSQ